MIAKSLDIYALAKLALEESARPYAVVAAELGMSASEFHAAVQRLGQAGLVEQKDRRIRQGAVREFLIHGLRYAFPVVMGGLTRGMPTSYAAPPLAEFISFGKENIPVWPDALGEKLGYGVEPLHPSAAKAARRDGRLYEVLALIDALRDGRTRERQIAEDELLKRIHRI
jgi:DNA-binding Lrp family transcriptional regulator